MSSRLALTGGNEGHVLAGISNWVSAPPVNEGLSGIVNDLRQ